MSVFWTEKCEWLIYVTELRAEKVLCDKVTGRSYSVPNIFFVVCSRAMWWWCFHAEPGEQLRISSWRVLTRSRAGELFVLFRTKSLIRGSGSLHSELEWKHKGCKVNEAASFMRWGRGGVLSFLFVSYISYKHILAPLGALCCCWRRDSMGVLKDSKVESYLSESELQDRLTSFCRSSSEWNLLSRQPWTAWATE